MHVYLRDVIFADVPRVIITTDALNKFEGQDVTIDCRVRANPAPFAARWLRDSEPFPLDSRHIMDSNPYSPKLTIKSINRSVPLRFVMHGMLNVSCM